MTGKEKAQMTRLWWKLEQGEASSADIERYRGLKVRRLKEKGEYTTADTQSATYGHNSTYTSGDTQLHAGLIGEKR